MKILGFNPSHHSSTCIVNNGEIEYFIQEERINKMKYVSFPMESFIDLLKNRTPDVVCLACASVFFPLCDQSDENLWHVITDIYLKENYEFFDFSFSHNQKKKPNNGGFHHIAHASSAFYNSGFKEALCLVVDGLGSITLDSGTETETLFKFSYPSNFEILHKKLYNDNFPKHVSESLPDNMTITTKINMGRVYETVTMYLGFSHNDAGKTMGLSSYGKYNKNIPNFLNKEGDGDPNVIIIDRDRKGEYEIDKNYQCTFIDKENNPYLKNKDATKWHHNKSNITDLEKDIAWKVQDETQKRVGDIIEKYVKETGLKKVCGSGGYFLNCVSNYYLKKRFPNIDFYFDPTSSDAGISLGAAKLLWHVRKNDTTIRPQKTLYNGPKYTNKEIYKKIREYLD